MEKPDRIGQLLLKEGMITEDKLQEALEKQKTVFTNKPLGEVLIQMGVIKENDFLRVLAKQFKTQYVTTEKLASLIIPTAILRLVPENVAGKHLVLPIQYSSKDKSLSIVTPDPLKVNVIDDVKFASGIGNIRALVAIESAVQAGIEKFYKGNERAFDVTLSVEGEESSGADQGYQDMFNTMMGSREITLEPEGGADDKVEIEITSEPSRADEVVRAPARPAKQKESIDIGLEPSQKSPKSIYLGGLDVFPGDDNLQREGMKQPEGKHGEEQPEVSKPVSAVKEKPKEAKKFHRKMLVVEPHEQIRKFITKLFGREGYEVKGVADRDSALPAVQFEPFDVVVIKEKILGEGSEFEEKLKQVAPNIELDVIKDYGSAVMGETRLYYKLIESFFESLDVVIGLMEMDREGLQGHTHEVAKYAKLIAQKLGLSRREIDETVMGAYAHEVGKKGLAHKTILNTLMGDSEKEALKDTIDIPTRLLGAANLPMDIQRALSNAFERFDGKGFPGKLAGEDIPMSARILAIVDSFAHLTVVGWNNRKYGIADAIGFLQEHAGKLFDPKLVDTIAQVVRDDLFVGRMDAAKEHILIADDEADLSTLLELKFVNAGFQVSTARNGEDALAKARQNRPDFILAEIDLPRMDGFKFIEALKKSDMGDIPFLYLSRKDDPSLITKSFDLGAEDVINKPVRMEVLYAKVQRIMERIKRTKKAAAPAGQVGGVSGSLSEMSLPDIVQILGAGRRTCLLTINHNSEKAEIYLEEGRIVNTVYKEMKGEEAFYAIIGWEEGSFNINPEVKIAERLINKNNDSLMLEGLRRLDEVNKGVAPEDIAIDGSDFF